MIMVDLGQKEYLEAPLQWSRLTHKVNGRSKRFVHSEHCAYNIWGSLHYSVKLIHKKLRNELWTKLFFIFYDVSVSSNIQTEKSSKTFLIDIAVDQQVPFFKHWLCNDSLIWKNFIFKWENKFACLSYVYTWWVYLVFS